MADSHNAVVRGTQDLSKALSLSHGSPNPGTVLHMASLPCQVQLQVRGTWQERCHLRVGAEMCWRAWGTPSLLAHSDTKGVPSNSLRAAQNLQRTGTCNPGTQVLSAESLVPCPISWCMAASRKTGRHQKSRRNPPRIRGPQPHDPPQMPMPQSS